VVESDTERWATPSGLLSGATAERHGVSFTIIPIQAIGAKAFTNPKRIRTRLQRRVGWFAPIASGASLFQSLISWSRRRRIRRQKTTKS